MSFMKFGAVNFVLLLGPYMKLNVDVHRATTWHSEGTACIAGHRILLFAFL